MVGQLPISRSEREVLRRFEEDPSGRQFLPLSDILRNHKLIEESMELLAQGVQEHPGFSVARVVLAREIFQRGLLVEAWTILDRAPFPLTDNVLAQKLKYKMSILLGDEASARTAYQYLTIQQGVDPEIKKIALQLDLDGIAAAREAYRVTLVQRGVDLHMPTVELKNSDTVRLDPKHTVSSSRGSKKRFVLEFELDESMRRQVEQFHVVSLSDVFSPEAEAGDIRKAGTSAPVELDSKTLADIYAKQGFYSKALAIYLRIQRMAPNNDMIRLKVAELEILNRQQINSDMDPNPVAYENLEVVEIIDRQARFINSLLEKLDKR
jgi:tetratricopeptide (TPR) repeat protein